MLDIYVAIIHSPLLWVAVLLLLVLLALTHVGVVHANVRERPHLFDRQQSGLFALGLVLGVFSLFALPILGSVLFNLLSSYPDSNAEAAEIRFHASLLLGTLGATGPPSR